MKANAVAAIDRSNGDRLEHVMRRIADFGSPSYPDWGSIASAGADAASRGDIDGARRSCKSCHDAYRSEYRQRDRRRALP